ncbi:hypothetical protein BVRB_4g088090 [Beta vulgaris subsp. vulgaris]|nr:hypothetical protein BVRB_4g088090 [Beta vulgaris subsp. vulgaris]
MSQPLGYHCSDNLKNSSCHSRDLLFYIEAYIKQDSRLIFRLYFKSHDIIPLTRRISLLFEFIDKNLILTR